jgi:hypothetical protein
MEQICINQGQTKNLTEGKTYNIIRTVNNFHYVTNDRGVVARYSAKLFNPVPAPAPEPIPVRNISLDDLEISVDQDELKISFEEHNRIDKLAYTYDVDGNADIGPSLISCGIHEFTAVNNFLTKFYNGIASFKIFLAEHNVQLDIEPASLLTEALVQLETMCLNLDIGTGLVIHSTNITNNGAINLYGNFEEEDVVGIFETVFNGDYSICHFADNPNSGNQIVLIITDKNQ